MGIALPIMALAGAGLGAVAQVRQGNAARKEAEFNATLAEQQATLTEAQGREEERKQRIYATKALGGIRTSYAASGVAQEGSVIDVLENSAYEAEMDALNIQYATKNKASYLRSQAGAYRIRGREAQTSGYLGAAGSIFGAAGSFAGSKGGS